MVLNLALFANNNGNLCRSSANLHRKTLQAFPFLVKSDFNYDGQASYLIGYAL